MSSESHPIPDRKAGDAVPPLAILLAEYTRLDGHIAHEREARDSRVNWYTLIIGGVVAGYGALSTQYTQALSDPALRTFVAFAGIAFLLSVGWEVFEAAQRFNLNVIAALIQMQKIRSYLATTAPDLERQLGWRGEPSLGHKRPLWVPTITLTINSFLSCLVTAIALQHRGLDSWPVFAIAAGLFAATVQIGYAFRRYRALLRAHQTAPSA